MKVTLVSLRPTEQAEAAGRPSLTPELLAASGARYSRNNEGLDAILAKIDPDNLDKSVDGLFRMIDYGHQSIADMAPIAMFLDGVSMWLAYLIWSWCPTAGGQESSTRYIKMDASQVLLPHGLDEEAWAQHVTTCFEAYLKALAFWSAVGERHPERTRIPTRLLEDPSEKAVKQVARMQRNFAFDRARVFLPVGLKTNVMLVMSARGWVNLCQRLHSHPLHEARQLGQCITEELGLAAPRLLKHAVAKLSFERGFRGEFEEAVRGKSLPITLAGTSNSDAPATAHLTLEGPSAAIERSLAHHDNRYAFLGTRLQMLSARFGWEAVTFGEIRDLNRHRTGSKECGTLPNGFYWCEDELPGDASPELGRLKEVGRAASRRAFEAMVDGDPRGVYWSLLGTQFPFEHLTTADKFLYEAELRTGTGAHYRYAKHLHDCLELWFERFPETRGLVLQGSAEPE